MNELYIGLISGTSADGIDAVVVDFEKNPPQLIASFLHPYTPSLRKTIFDLCEPGLDEINRLGELDVLLGQEFAYAANHLLKTNAILPEMVRAIGSHGQNIRHHPERRFTLQIGDPNIIAARTGITTVADFRRRDIAHGGQGAPLAPAFHQTIFSDPEQHRVILNIGGIANITLLSADHQQKILGYDTGPGNVLMDMWIEKHLHQTRDEKGIWASQGKVNKDLLKQLLNDPYFTLPPPKSSGREYFNLLWLNQYLSADISPVDVQATLAELTAVSIVEDIKQYFSSGEILVCGGGVHNDFLMQRLSALSAPLTVSSTAEKGIDPDYIEAMTFAWLAKQTLSGKPGNLTAITGAKAATVLGGVYY